MGGDGRMKEVLQEEIKQALAKMNVKEIETITVEIPKSKENGDFATNIAMQLARTLSKNPREIAEELIQNMDATKFLKIEIKGPGFINFFVDKTYLLDNIHQVLVENENYGKSTIGQNEKVNLEYVSANPTGILHLGHARGAAYGDSLARILKFAGYDVTREYYINDAGNQMDNLARSIKVRYENLCGIDSELPENGYHGKEIIVIAKKLYEENQERCLKEDLSYFKQYGLTILLEQIKKDLQDFDVSFDVWTSEQSIYDRNLVKETLDKLIQLDQTYQQEDAIFLKTSLYGDEKDRVLVKKDGNNTYLLPDIAYHSDKYQRGFEKIIDVLGADHHGYIPRLKASMEMLGYDSNKINVKILQMVRLLQDGQEIKMSKRTGKSVTIRDLLDEVGKDVIRYFFVSHSLDSQMDFDLDLALKQSNENPIYYINYAHARICAILRSATNTDYQNIIKYNTIDSEDAYNVLNKVYQFKEIVERAALKEEVHIITNYAYELASLFHTYYAKEKIVTENQEYTSERLALIKAVQITLKNALYLIGVDAYEKM